MERMTRKAFHSGNRGEFWFSEGTVRTNDELRAHCVALISLHMPKLLRLVPAGLGNRGIEYCQIV